MQSLSKPLQYIPNPPIPPLILFQKHTAFHHYIQTRIPINSHISQHLLTNLFIPNTPLHHPPIIIQRTNIPLPPTYLPLSHTLKISKTLP
ncbi:diadenylate cyclase, partial [Staphylococcus epidermidis]|uniref:diadenylate cyclase n=1 Tax=Staphylococcus epidermidis TaxID=1282 RepID=UPI0037D99CEE